MKAAVILSLATVALGSVFEKRACAGNNCNRQVTGTRDGLLPITSRQADCSSFQLTVVTPSPTTVTVTVTEEPAAKLKRNEVKVAARQETAIPTDVPAYASSCDAPKYASACDCWGITAAVTTAPTPTVTVTTTIDYCEDL